MPHMEERDNLYIKILMYHRIVKNGSRDMAYHDVELDNFKQQLKLLDSLNYTPITFEDYHLYKKGILTLPKKPIIITFDDGHVDMIKYAMPALKEYDMKAVVFVLGDRSIKYANWDGEAEGTGPELMTGKQIRELRNEGFEIGAHTMTHPDLTKLPYAKVKEEVINSKQEVEDLLGEEVRSFAYPFGGVNKDAEHIVKEAEFEFGCGVYTGPPKFGENMYDLRRLAITCKVNTTGYLLRILSPYEYVEWLYGKLRNNGNGAYGAAQRSAKAPIRDYDFTTTNNF